MSSRSETNDVQVQSYDSWRIERLFAGEWVLVEVTRDAKRHESIRGRLVAHGPDPDALAEQDVKFRADRPGTVTYMFHTTRTVPDDVVIVL